jgi:hypothetical protein
MSLLGCKNPQIIWSSEVKSPDGKMVATGTAYANGGFGVSGAPATFVYLNWASGSQKPKEIAEFSNESDTPEGVAVGIRWVSSNEVEITYRKDKQDVDFQAVKFLQVKIDTQEAAKQSSEDK